MLKCLGVGFVSGMRKVGGRGANMVHIFYYGILMFSVSSDTLISHTVRRVGLNIANAVPNVTAAVTRAGASTAPFEAHFASPSHLLS